MQEENEKYISLDMETMQALFGQYDQYLSKIEKQMHVSFIDRDGRLKIQGSPERVEQAEKLILSLAGSVREGGQIDRQRVEYAMDLSENGEDVSLTEMDRDLICHTVAGKKVTPKTKGQLDYVNSMREKMIVFGIGPAGTGKTYLAMAMAITAFKKNEVERIILTRPAIEAGEKLGFLPGDLQSKVDPYLRPLYDALYQIMGAESFVRNMEKGLIEVAPLAYMRGRTLDNAFIILDEAQNTTQAQMKMFLTRIGFGSKVVITGDRSQKDLPGDVKSGLDVAVEVLKNVDEIAFCTLTARDVVRHPLVQRIVKAYDEYEKNQSRENKYRNGKYPKIAAARRKHSTGSNG